MSDVRLARPLEVARFWRRVDKSGGAEACWPWLGAKTGGYGTVRMVGEMQRAHRVAFVLANGPPLAHVLHRCDNPPCCNPAHLFDGSDADNVADMVAKRRHGAVKLTERQERIAAVMLARGADRRAVANLFGVSYGHAGRLRRRYA